MAVLLAIGSALIVGSGDFFGGFAGRRGPVMAVTLWVHVVGLVAALALSGLFGGDPTAADLWWGAASGVGGGLGVLFLYRGFAVSRMGVVAPVSAVVAATAPVAFGIVDGERPGVLVFLGIGMGIAAIALISRQPGTGGGTTTRVGVLYGLATGVGFGSLFILLSRTEDGSGFWPVASSRLGGTIVMIVVALASRSAMRPVPSAWRPLALSALLGSIGNGLFVLASQEGLLSVVAVITSMYPAATVVWARLVLDERLQRSQLAGVGVALAAVGLIAGG